MSSNRKTANGNDIEKYNRDTRQYARENEQNARVVAAKLPRDMDGLDRIEGGPHGVALWFGADSEAVGVPAPDGWEIETVSTFASGRMAVQIRPE